jgi:hypothetical protein
MGARVARSRAAAGAEDNRPNSADSSNDSSSATNFQKASSSTSSSRGAVDLSIIVHPAFTHKLKSPPETFCPLDWLPDEVISNVLVHLVRLWTHSTFIFCLGPIILILCAMASNNQACS